MAGGIIHIFGASGTGKTTLSRALGQALSLPCYDTDDYYWVQTNPPYQINRSYEQIESLLSADIAHTPDCVVGGTLYRYPSLVQQLRFVVFLSMNHKARMARLMAREQERYGKRMLPGGDMHETHLDFIRWAELYETSRTEPGNRHMQESWLDTLFCPVLRLDAALATAEQVAAIQQALTGTAQSPPFPV